MKSIPRKQIRAIKSKRLPNNDLVILGRKIVNGKTTDDFIIRGNGKNLITKDSVVAHNAYKHRITK